jgi:hypothetical protein
MTDIDVQRLADETGLPMHDLKGLALLSAQHGDIAMYPIVSR